MRSKRRTDGELSVGGDALHFRCRRPDAGAYLLMNL